MSNTEPAFQFEMHPIKLSSVNVKELSIILKNHPSQINIGEGELNFQSAGTAYNAEIHSFAVFVKVEIGYDERTEDSPIMLKVEMFGEFEVDEEKFDIEQLDDFKERNAPAILFPYLREQVYALSMRAGIDPVLMPLIVVPTFKYQPKQQ